MTNVRISTALLFAVLAAAPASAQSGPGPQGPTLLIHGNYCGPGNNAPLAPVDALDAACARHDACTPDGGLPTKACNLRLQREAALVARDPHQPEDVRAMAGFVSTGAALMPSEPRPSRPLTPIPTTVGHVAPTEGDGSHAALDPAPDADPEAE